MLRNIIKRSQQHLSKRLTSILSGQRDRFGGVTVYSSDYPGVSDFKKVLRSVHEYFFCERYIYSIHFYLLKYKMNLLKYKFTWMAWNRCSWSLVPHWRYGIVELDSIPSRIWIYFSSCKRQKCSFGEVASRARVIRYPRIPVNVCRCWYYHIKQQ